MTADQLKQIEGITPTPWETSTCATLQRKIWDICAAGGGDMIADLAGCENAESDAKFIVQACNNHARLVEERAKLLEACKQLLATGSFRKNGDQGEAAAQRAQSAIAFAESE